MTSPGLCPADELLDLMGHPQPLQHHEHLAEGGRVALGERAVGRGGRESRRRRRRRDVTGEPTPPRQVHDRRDRVALEVERAAAPRQHVAQRAGAHPSGRARRAVAAAAHSGVRRASCGTPPGTVCSAASPHTTRPSSSSDDRISPLSTSGSSSQPLAARGPIALGASEVRARRDGAVAVRRQPAAVEDGVGAAGDRPQLPTRRRQVVPPRQCAVDVGGRHGLASGDAAEGQPRESRRRGARVGRAPRRAPVRAPVAPRCR